MWRTTSYNLLKHTLRTKTTLTTPLPRFWGPHKLLTSSHCISSSAAVGGGGENGNGKDGNEISYGEAKNLMRLVNVEGLKKKLEIENKEVIGYGELLKACESMGVAKSADEAAAFAKVLDEAGVVLLFRDKVYLHPHKLVDLVRKAVPLALLPEDDPSNDELKVLQTKKEEIEVLAHKQILLSGNWGMLQDRATIGSRIHSKGEN